MCLPWNKKDNGGGICAVPLPFSAILGFSQCPFQAKGVGEYSWMLNISSVFPGFALCP